MDGVVPGSVVWLCGPPGVGKSTVAWALFAADAREGRVTGYVDIDQLGMRQPAPAYDRSNTLVKAANLAAVLAGYAVAGSTRTIVSGVAAPDEVPHFAAATGGITWVRLRADGAALQHRFLGRGHGPAELDELDRYAAALDRSDFSQVVVDTTGLDPAAVLVRVAEARPGLPRPAHSPGPGPLQPVPVPSGGPTPRVLLLTGPRAVGCSTIGFEAFLRLPRSAFVDLAQIGFVGPATTDPLDRHAVRAENLAAMTRNFAEDGAEVVIAVGALLPPDAVHRYAAALPVGSLMVCRLRADASDLRARVEARVKHSGGPYLAGDDLRGASADHLGTVQHRSVTEADRLDRSGLGDLVLDTTDRAPAECVTELLDRAGLGS